MWETQSSSTGLALLRSPLTMLVWKREVVKFFEHMLKPQLLCQCCWSLYLLVTMASAMLPLSAAVAVAVVIAPALLPLPAVVAVAIASALLPLPAAVAVVVAKLDRQWPGWQCPPPHQRSYVAWKRPQGLAPPGLPPSSWCL